MISFKDWLRKDEVATMSGGGGGGGGGVWGYEISQWDILTRRCV